MRWCVLPPNWRLRLRAFSWTTRRRITKAIQSVINQVDVLSVEPVRREDEDHGLEQAASLSGARIGRQGRDQVGQSGEFLRPVAGGDETGAAAAGRGGPLQLDRSVLDAAAKDPAIKQTLIETAVAADSELISPFFQWKYNGRPAGNGWNSPVNNAQWGTDYLNRTGTAKSNMYDNQPEETKYIYTRLRQPGQQLDGQNNYTRSLSPKVRCLRSRASGRSPCTTSYHLFNPNPLDRYSLGTKNKAFLKYNADGSLTLYLGANRPAKTRKPTGYRRRTVRSRCTFALTGPTSHPRRYLDAAPNVEWVK